MSQNVITSTNLTNFTPAHRGKVRDLYDLGDEFLIVSTDRISAFDVVLPNGIPDKGRVLTGLSKFWFNYTNSVVENHVIATDVEEYPEALHVDAELLNGRSMLVRKAKRVDVECVVRGYLAGSGWASYQKTGEICGQKLPAGLRESEQLPELLFTPTTKAEQGEHDEPISIDQMRDEVGTDLTDQLIEISFALFRAASQHAEKSGIILCDTKFEFGQCDGELILIDEVFTPDSSRFWPANLYEPGKPQQSFDKQFVRDYLSEIGWNKQPPAPELPDAVISKTSEKYREAYKLIVGEELQELS
ncbi:phosphoribosylaminoimidazolesuccinocarboxamide synthase [Candidatus Poribacteria bacterium]|nr:phosphoribosylaminoimidazolesuccinocarboxamide synthase [Candidatus Poribacteria bacterium]